MVKHSESRLSYLFAHLYLLSSDSFSSTLLSSNLSLLSASALLCFSSVHIVGSLTSKLPSITVITYCILLLYIMFLFDCVYDDQSYCNLQESKTITAMPNVPCQHLATPSCQSRSFQLFQFFPAHVPHFRTFSHKHSKHSKCIKLQVYICSFSSFFRRPGRLALHFPSSKVRNHLHFRWLSAPAGLRTELARR